jgi:hypothetical protein
MRQLGLRTTIKQALIGVSYVCDCELQQTHPPIPVNEKSINSQSPPLAPRKNILNAYHKIG